MNSTIKEHELGLTEIVSEGVKIFFFKFRDISLLILVSFIPTILTTIIFTDKLPSQDITINIIN